MQPSLWMEFLMEHAFQTLRAAFFGSAATLLLLGESWFPAACFLVALAIQACPDESWHKFVRRFCK